MSTSAWIAKLCLSMRVMHSRYGFIVIGAASATAFVIALIDYAFGLGQNLTAAALHFLATVVITAVAFAVSWRLDKPEKAAEADRGHDLDPLPSTPVEPTLPSDDPLDVERLSEAVSGCSPFVHNLGEHIESAIKDTELAALTIISKLQRADNILEGLVQYLKGSANEKIIPIIEQTQECLRENNALFGQFLACRTEAMKESRTRLAGITGLVCNLDGIVHSIREVAQQTHLLALNATIEAARVGDAGRGFVVVAAEVKALSRQSDRAAKDISEGLQTLKAAIDESVEALTVRQAREEKMDMDSITLRIDELGQDLKSLVEQEQEIIVKTQQDSEEISRIVIDLLGSMQYQDLIRQKLDRATKNIDHIVNHALDLTALIQRARSGKNLPSIATFSQDTTKSTNIYTINDGENRAIELF